MGKFDGILIASDFDRTLTDPAGFVPTRNLDALRFFMEEGGRFSIASGRSVPMFRPKMSLYESNAPAILYNGAACWDPVGERIVFGTPLPRMDTLIEEILKRYPFPNCELQGIDRHCIFRLDREREKMFRETGVRLYDRPYREIGDPMYMLFLGVDFIPPEDPSQDFRSTSPDIEALFTECNEWIERQGPFTAIRSTGRITEVIPRGISKGSAARKLAEMLGCRKLVCVGDAMNDIGMLEAADYAFTPSDGDPAVRRQLRSRIRITGPSSEGALAGVIETLKEIL